MLCVLFRGERSSKSLPTVTFIDAAQESELKLGVEPTEFEKTHIHNLGRV